MLRTLIPPQSPLPGSPRGFHLRAAVALAIALWCSGAVLHADVTYISRVDGVRYECEVRDDAVAGSGGWMQYTAKPNHMYQSEPKGRVSLTQAMALAEKEAIRILKDGYTAKDPRWILTSATRTEQKDTKGNEVGFYYHFSFNTRAGAYSSEEYTGPRGNLSVIVLLDGTVMENRKTE